MSTRDPSPAVPSTQESYVPAAPPGAGSVEAVFLDFDGVVLDSVHLKEQEFRAMMLEKVPEHVDAAMELYLAHGGVSRRVKFQWIWRDLLGKPASEAELDALSNEFADRVFQKVLTCPFIPGALEFLQAYHRSAHLFYISGTPEPELRRIVIGRQLHRYVTGIYGSPSTKIEVGERLFEKHGFRRDRVWFVGDATTDRDAANALGVRFIGIDGPHLTPYLNGSEIMIPDMHRLAEVLESRH